jgi:hypothetical protein
MDNNKVYEFKTFSIVIKIWLEDDLRWRGHITHIPSGIRRYIEELSEIEEFILPYLEEIGIHSKLMEQLFRFMRRKTSRRQTTGKHPRGQEKEGGTSG